MNLTLQIWPYDQITREQSGIISKNCAFVRSSMVGVPGRVAVVIQACFVSIFLSCGIELHQQGIYHT